MIVCFSYQDILELTLFYIYSERNWGKSNVLLAEIWYFCHFCIQSEWKIVRRWHHQLAHLHIHSDWSRTVSWKFAKFHNFLIFQPIFIRFSLFCSENFTLSSKIKLNLFRITSLKHKDSFGKSENLSKIFFAEILVFDHDYEGKSSSSNGLLWISFIFF